MEEIKQEQLQGQGAWARLYFKPFEVAIGVYVILNGIMTFSGESAAKESLWNIIGTPSVLIPIWQIISGIAKILGIAINKANLEVFGLISVASMFLIRAIALVADGDITLQDVNAVSISMLIIICNATRISQILLDYKSIYLYIRNPK
jgi:hypothetical protein